MSFMDSSCPLSGLKPGSCGTVECLHLELSDAFRLRELGFLPGTIIRLVRRAPLGDPIEVEIGGAHLALRQKDAALIQVRTDSDA